MNVLVMAGQLILGLAILVTLHELGHFLAARMFGIRVEKFYLFFDAWGFKFFSFRKGDTEYGIGWLPLGGYVKIAGMIDESLDSDAMKQPPQPWEFRSKPAWQRLIVMVGGVFMNVILGIAIYTMVLSKYEKNYLPNSEVRDGIYAFELGKKIGLQDHDQIVAINGKPFVRFEDVLSSRVILGNSITVNRNGKEIEIPIPDGFYRETMKMGKGNFVAPYQAHLKIDSVFAGLPAAAAGIREGDKLLSVNGQRVFSVETCKKIIGQNKSNSVTVQVARGNDTLTIMPVVNDSGLIGVRFMPDFGNYPLTDYTLGSAFYFGTSDAFEAIISNIKGLKQILRGKEKASENLQGPIGIATIYGPVLEWSRFWTITGLLSMIVAFMSILPIPALDGGHVVFLLIEAITRKRFSDKFMERAQIAGMIILLSLMAFSVGNDIWKHWLN